MNIASRIAASLFALAASMAGAAWPDHPIHWVVPFAAGGANDLIARAAAEGVSRQLGQTIVIDNKPGAGTVVGSDYAAKAKPDGYTFLIGSAGTITNSMIRHDMPYADSDIVPVGMIAVAPSIIVVNPSVPAANLKEFMSYTRKTDKVSLGCLAVMGVLLTFVLVATRCSRGQRVDGTRSTERYVRR